MMARIVLLPSIWMNQQQFGMDAGAVPSTPPRQASDFAQDFACGLRRPQKRLKMNQQQFGMDAKP
jgi:hypothetical protein